MRATLLLAIGGLLLLTPAAGCQNGPLQRTVTNLTAGALHQAAAEQRLRETHPSDPLPPGTTDTWVPPQAK